MQSSFLSNGVQAIALLRSKRGQLFSFMRPSYQLWIDQTWLWGHWSSVIGFVSLADPSTMSHSSHTHCITHTASHTMSLITHCNTHHTMSHSSHNVTLITQCHTHHTHNVTLHHHTHCHTHHTLSLHHTQVTKSSDTSPSLKQATTLLDYRSIWCLGQMRGQLIQLCQKCACNWQITLQILRIFLKWLQEGALECICHKRRKA